MTYSYYFGTYNSDIEITGSHTQYSTSGEQTITPQTVTLMPWELKHVDSISESVSTQASTIGLPNKPAECVYIYDTGGPIRSFSISGKRYDAEEDVSNLDFLFNQFNPVPVEITTDLPLVDETETITYYSIGLEWLESTLQSTLKGYTFIKSSDERDNRIPIYTVNDNTYQEQYNVAIVGFSAEFDVESPGVMQYTINLIERKAYPSGQIYREYISEITRG